MNSIPKFRIKHPFHRLLPSERISETNRLAKKLKRAVSRHPECNYFLVETEKVKEFVNIKFIPIVTDKD